MFIKFYKLETHGKQLVTLLCLEKKNGIKIKPHLFSDKRRKMVVFQKIADNAQEKKDKVIGILKSDIRSKHSNQDRVSKK